MLKKESYRLAMMKISKIRTKEHLKLLCIYETSAYSQIELPDRLHAEELDQRPMMS